MIAWDPDTAYKNIVPCLFNIDIVRILVSVQFGMFTQVSIRHAEFKIRFVESYIPYLAPFNSATMVTFYIIAQMPGFDEKSSQRIGIDNLRSIISLRSFWLESLQPSFYPS